MTQLEFLREVTQILLHVDTVTQKPHNPALGPSQNVMDDIRYDDVGHYIVPAGTQGRCRVCMKNTKRSCSKCNVNLHEGCFINYHIRH